MSSDIRGIMLALADSARRIKRTKVLRIVVDDQTKEDIRSSRLERLDPPKIAKLGLRREKGWLYYIDSDGDIARVRKSRGSRSSSKNDEIKRLRKSIADLEKKHTAISGSGESDRHALLKKKIDHLKKKLASL